MTTALSLDTFRRCWEAAAPPAPSSGRGCIEQILVTFPLLFFFFCSLRQHLMCFATLCKRWLPPPPASSLLHFSAGSWVWPWGFFGFSGKLLMLDLPTEFKRSRGEVSLLRLFIMSPCGSAQDGPHRRSNATTTTDESSMERKQ